MFIKILWKGREGIQVTLFDVFLEVSSDIT